MNRFVDFSIKSKLSISILSILFISLCIASAFMLVTLNQKATDDLIKGSKLQSQLVAEYITTPLLFSDVSGTKDILKKLIAIRSINAAVVYDENGNIFTDYTRTKSTSGYSKKTTRFVDSDEIIGDEIIISTPVRHNNQTYGVVVFHVSTGNISEEMFTYALYFVLATILLLVFSLLLIFRLQNYITLPILNLANTAREIALSQDYTIRAQKMNLDEVGQLYDDFNSMLGKIEQRGREREEAETISRTYQAHLERLTNELEERVKGRTDELQESLNSLQGAQTQLVESEKMSALGSLVAGVAHEVNTPLGISITAASIFKNELRDVKALLDKGKLSKVALENFIETITEADDILIKNLDRAALLVRNFKMISVDQSSEDIRDFELNEYLHEVISTFKNELKHRPIQLNLDFETKKIPMHTFPGAISQIVVNMLQNALLHGFEYDQEGEITLTTRQLKDKVKIIFCDNGKGVDTNFVNKIFEPFITTKRNKGGTGLGLNITYNLAKKHLKGSIVLDTSYTDGAKFILEIPCKI